MSSCLSLLAGGNVGSWDASSSRWGQHVDAGLGFVQLPCLCCECEKIPSWWWKQFKVPHLCPNLTVC